jgi:hypothetical protein
MYENYAYEQCQNPATHGSTVVSSLEKIITFLDSLGNEMGLLEHYIRSEYILYHV